MTTWDFCKAINCEHLIEKTAIQCGVDLEPFDCEQDMNEIETRMYQKYLEKEEG